MTDPHKTAKAVSKNFIKGIGPAHELRKLTDLSESEVEALHGRLVDAVEKEVKATLREQE